MSAAFARKPIAELQPDEESAHSLKRVLGAGDLVMPAIGVVIGAGIGLPYQAWERFAIWLLLGLVTYVLYGARHSRLRKTA